KLVGIYAILQAVPYAGRLWPMLTAPNIIVQRYVAYELAICAFYGGVGILLFVYAQRLANRLLPPPAAGQGTVPEPISVNDLQAAAFAVAGIVLIAFFSVPGFVLDWGKHFYGQQPVGPVQQPTDLRRYV